VINILFKSLKGTDWEMLTAFVSPVFFEVVPTLGMAKVFGTIVKDFANTLEFERVRDAAKESLDKVNAKETCELKILAVLTQKKPSGTLALAERQAFGHMVLKIYFAQIFSNHKSILDLRSSAFDGRLEWAPKAVYFKWSDEFRAGLRDLYLGFYTNDDARLNAGLLKLNLMHAKSVINGHFGEGEQDAVRFSLGHLKKSLHAVFISCKENKAKLHPDFFAMGAYLLCLYENLEGLDCPLDVRRAFLEVARP
jgi:hypothetical protein